MKTKSFAFVLGVITLNLILFPSINQAKQPIKQPAQQQTKQAVSNTQIAAIVEALRLAAPQPKKQNPGYHTEWQIKPETLKGWSKNCLKKDLPASQFENNSGLTRQVISCIMSRELNKQFQATNNNENIAVRGVACWWMTGNYSGCDKGFTGEYVEKVVRFYKQEISKPVKKR